MPEANQTAILIGPPAESIKPGEEVPTEEPPVVLEAIKIEDLPSGVSEPIEKDNVTLLMLLFFPVMTLPSKIRFV